jgi:GrpB-like predicted nucleotidyltransferase (UPF0157 family)
VTVPNPPGGVPELPDQPIVIVPYDPAWPAMFEEEKSRILEVCGEWLVAVEHMGSTSVPGLAAKPIIDIMPGLRRLEDGIHCIKPMQSLGYHYMGEFGVPGRMYFTRGTPRTYNVHMFLFGDPEWQRNLRFRDYLRAHPQAAAEYEALKKILADRHRDEREAYTHAKTQFIQGIQLRALGDPLV